MNVMIIISFILLVNEVRSVIFLVYQLQLNKYLLELTINSQICMSITYLMYLFFFSL